MTEFSAAGLDGIQGLLSIGATGVAFEINDSLPFVVAEQWARLLKPGQPVTKSYRVLGLGALPPMYACHRAFIARAEPNHVVSSCAPNSMNWSFLVIRFHADRLIFPDNAEVAGSIPASPTIDSAGHYLFL